MTHHDSRHPVSTGFTASDSGAGRGYRPVPARIDLVALEHEIIRRWQDEATFERTLAASAGRPRWTFYEGPPTANGMPGTHHIEARVFKDVFPRYRTMRGYHVERKGGWDCHGLPVEIAVESELGINGKNEIEAFGVEAFNARCRESVLRHVDAFTELTTRMGYWVDTDHPYRTMDRTFIESEWWALKQVFAAGLLVEDYRVTPYCPRCGTGLSDHELAQGYETITDPSVYVRFSLTAGPLVERFGEVSLLIWTTTPWTLVSNTAAAVNPDLGYVLARTAAGEQLIVAAARREQVLGADSEVLAELAGQDLVGTAYRRPFDWVVFPETDAPVHTVLAADFVAGDDGTGIVHQAPAFGAEDFALCRANGLPIVNPVGTNGRFDADLPLVGGVFVKTADDALVAELASGTALPPPGVRPLLPALLALPHTADLLRPAVLVHPHHRGQSGAVAGERGHRLAPGDAQARPVRRLAGQQCRLGAVPQPLLGHPAADLAQRRRPGPDGLHRVAGRAVRADRDRPVRAGSPPSLHRRHHLPGRR